MDLQEQYEKLLRYCYMKTKDRCIAEDIVQETFLRFWQSKAYKDMGKEQAYLYTIARNLCMDEFRRPVVFDIDNHLEISGDVKTDADKAIEKIAVEQALSTIPGELREIVTLRYISDISVSDISQIMHMSRFAVYRRIKEGLALLRNLLEESEGDR